MSTMRQRLTVWRLPALLAGLCLALAALVAWQVQRPMTRPAPAVVAGSAPEVTAAEAVPGDGEPDEPGDGLAVSDIESFAATVERPLFHRSRRPVPVAEDSETAAAAGAGVPFQLSGVLVAGRTRVALLRNPASARILRAEEGDTVDGWRIEAIRPQSVVVRSGQTREEMTLADRLAPSPPRPPQGARKQGPPSFERGKTALPAQRSGAAAGRGGGEGPEE